MSRARHNGPHSTGGARKQMTPEWKAEVRQLLRDRDLSEQWLADRVTERRGLRKSMKRDTINKMLNRQESSSLVDDVCVILGVGPPLTVPRRSDPETERLIELVLRATPEKRRGLILLLEDDSTSE